MGFIQINDEFIYIEPVNQTHTADGHAHRVYRRKRTAEEKATENKTSHYPYCGVAGIVDSMSVFFHFICFYLLT